MDIAKLQELANKPGYIVINSDLLAELDKATTAKDPGVTAALGRGLPPHKLSINAKTIKTMLAGVSGAAPDKTPDAPADVPGAASVSKK